MGTPHKHADLIKAWADGVEIQGRYKEDPWFTYTTEITPEWKNNIEYRIKPKTIKYRVALFNGKTVPYTLTCHSEPGAYEAEQLAIFNRWLGDWIEVEV